MQHTLAPSWEPFDLTLGSVDLLNPVEFSVYDYHEDGSDYIGSFCFNHMTEILELSKPSNWGARRTLLASTGKSAVGGKGRREVSVLIFQSISLVS